MITRIVSETPGPLVPSTEPAARVAGAIQLCWAIIQAGAGIRAVRAECAMRRRPSGSLVATTFRGEPSEITGTTRVPLAVADSTEGRTSAIESAAAAREGGEMSLNTERNMRILELQQHECSESRPRALFNVSKARHARLKNAICNIR